MSSVIQFIGAYNYFTLGALPTVENDTIYQTVFTSQVFTFLQIIQQLIATYVVGNNNCGSI